MKAHELARQLLAGPDLPVVVSRPYLGDLEEVDGVQLRDDFSPVVYGWADVDGWSQITPAVELT